MNSEIVKELEKYSNKNNLGKKFIEKALLKHGIKFDYSKVDYISSDKKIIIICPEHGEFTQIATNHLRTYGCKGCGMKQKSKTTINKSKELYYEYVSKLHNNKYKYFDDYTHSENYIKIECPEHGVFTQLACNHRQRSGCPKCGIVSQKNKVTRPKDSFFEYVKRLHNNKYTYFDDYITSQDYIKIECPEHGIFTQIAHNHLQGKGCSKCSNLNTISKPEQEILEYIKFLEIINIEQKNRTILQGKELDIYLPDYKLAIEFNGLYWHDEYSKSDNYHLSKTEKCEEKGIQLIHIFEDEWLFKKDIVKSRIKNLIHKIEKNKVIYARKCFVKKIDISTAKLFTERNHLQGFVGAKIHLGLFFKQNNKEYLVSYMSFGSLRLPTGNKNINENHYELLRFCNVIDYRVIGGASKLLKYFEKTYKPEKILSYADRRWSNGNLYNQLGFNLKHKSKPNYFYVEGLKRHNRFNFTLDKLKTKYPTTINNMTEKEFCRDILKFPRIYDSGSLVYEKYFI